MPTINTWVQDTEPTVGVLAFDNWIMPTAGQQFSRNKTNSAWIFQGYTEEVYSGAMPVAGGTATGPFTGVTGWAPSDSADISTFLRRDGFDVARLVDLDALRREIYANIENSLISVLGSQASLSSVGQNMAWGAGRISVTTSGTTNDVPFTIPPPIFQGNTPATLSQCVLAQAFLVDTGRNINNTAAWHTYTYPSIPAPAVTLNWVAGAATTSGSVEMSAGYIVIAVR